MPATIRPSAGPAPGCRTRSKSLERATQWLLGGQHNDLDTALAGATPYLRLFALAAGGAFLAEEALAARQACRQRRRCGGAHRDRALLCGKSGGAGRRRSSAPWSRPPTASTTRTQRWVSNHAPQEPHALHHRRVARHRARDRAARRARRRQHRHRRQDRHAASEAAGHDLHRRRGDRRGRRQRRCRSWSTCATRRR